MKSLLLSAAIILLLQTIYAQGTLIGVKNKGAYTITANKDTLQAEWNALLKEQHINGELVHFKIIGFIDSASGNETIPALFAKNKTGTVKVVTLLHVVGNYLYKGPSNTPIAICHGCNKGCDPVYNQGQWMCSPCKNNALKCTKTVTVSF